MERKWIQSSKWKRAELDSKSIEFSLRTPDFLIRGIGKLQVYENGEGDISINIVVLEMSNDGNRQSWVTYQLFSTQIADRIEVHPDMAVAHFRLIC